MKYSQDQSPSMMLLFRSIFFFFAVILGGDVPKHSAQIVGHNVYNPIIDQP